MDIDTQRVNEALESGDFAGAYSLLKDHEGEISAELLELRARAAYGSGDYEGALTAYETLHRLHLDAGRTVEAAAAAVTVGMYLMMDTGLMAPVRAWLARAERLIADDPDCPVWAALSAIRTYERFMCGDMEGAGRCAEQAIEIGTRYDMTQPIMVGRMALGRVRFHSGQIDEGLRMLDDVALELSTGALDPLTTGMMWCELICAMQWVGQYDRAEEWTEAMERWRQGAAFGSLTGRCRVHRAEIMRMRGPCDAAEQEALLACEELRPWMRREYGWPLTELGNVRFRKGDFAGAEEAYLAAHQNAWSPQPGLALLRLAQGRVEEACALIDNALRDPFDIPSKEYPPAGGLRRAPLLDAQVVIVLAVGRVEDAKAAAAELSEIAEKYRSRTIANNAMAARGRIALAESEHDRAIVALKTAVNEFMALRMPFEAASLRMVLAEAHQSAGDPQNAELERSAARRCFEELGAQLWVERCAPSRDVDRAPEADNTLNQAEQAQQQAACVFRCLGDMRAITFDGTSIVLKDLKGMRYLERLLCEPGREFHALDMVEVERGALPTGREHAVVDSGLEVFDATARDAYRRRLREVEDDIAEAEANNDLERLRLARADRDFLVDELARGVGLGGRARKVGSGAEKARTSATRSLRYALDRIATHHPSLGEHLQRTVQTGTYFQYAPDPQAKLRWHT